MSVYGFFSSLFILVKTYHEQIQIKDGSIGNSYEKLFKRFFDDTVTSITIEDPYIRAFHQVINFFLNKISFIR